MSPAVCWLCNESFGPTPQPRAARTPRPTMSKARPVRHPPPAARHTQSRMRGARPIDIVTEILDGVPVPRPGGRHADPHRLGAVGRRSPLRGVRPVIRCDRVPRRRDRSGHSGGRSRAAASTSTKPTLGRPPTHAPAGAGRRTGPRRPRGDQPSRSRSPFCDCSTPLPEPEVSISRSRRSPATVRCTAPTVCPPLVEGCSISDPSGSTMSKDSGSHASGTARHPGSADRPPADRSASADPGPGRR